MRILLADDHELVRDTLAAYLQQSGEIKVSAVGSFDEARTAINNSGPFDLVLLDYTMPGMHELDGLSEAIRLNAGKPVGLISGTASPAVAEQALAAGAAGFVPKSMAAKSLIHAVNLMAAGECYAPFSFLNQKPPEPETPALSTQLSRREREVLLCLTQGLANKEIARQLDIQEVTVKLHVKTLCRKLDARNRTHAAMIAKEGGLV
ncbi:response regulator transcription factor [Rhodovibrio salinarum]|uniref:DNA-binding response regulator n=1 Tax=Rhodovibrio salinarum TaxID=1087 RepID=A0A934QFZ9_9PROT|nr:response regulator transcription factor [Rhodovibrio salinarum]MBK1696293.1 DNA-binding response regulator [Rhodovibrio salinarum]